MEWADILASAGFQASAYQNDGLLFHHLSMQDSLRLTLAMQRNQKHLDDFLPMFSKQETKNVAKIQAWVHSLLDEDFPSQHFLFTYQGTLCGFASTLPVSSDPREIQLRYMVFEGFTGRGIATRIAATLELYAFQVWGFHKVFIEMDSQNRASMRVAQKLNYSFCGTTDHPRIGKKGSGFWYRYVKERPSNLDDAILQGKDLDQFL